MHICIPRSVYTHHRLSGSLNFGHHLVRFIFSIFSIIWRLQFSSYGLTVDHLCHCHYLRWRMPPFMRQCWGLQVCPMLETTGFGKLINAVLPSFRVNSSAPLVCRRDRVTWEARHVGLVRRDRGRRWYWVALYLYIYTARLLMSVFL